MKLYEHLAGTGLRFLTIHLDKFVDTKLLNFVRLHKITSRETEASKTPTGKALAALAASRVRLLLLPCSFQIELYYNVVANEVVRFTGVDDTKVLTVDRKFGVDRDICRTEGYRSRETHRLTHATQFQIAGHGIFVGAFRRLGCYLRRCKRRFWKLFYLEEVACLKMLR